MEAQYSQRLKLMHALCVAATARDDETPDRKSTRLNSSHH